jgi:uncharacterized phage infection (PIP) family protein YhgE
LQAAGQDRENALLAARDEAAEQLKAAQDAAAAAAAQLAEVQAAAKAEAERLAGERQELDKQLKVAQVCRRCILLIGLCRQGYAAKDPAQISQCCA